MKTRYSIGEVSKLFKIPITTLRHYHNKGVFKAGYIDEESGYRYYYSEQFEMLNNILSLKNSELSLEKIKEVTSNQDKAPLKETLKNQKKIVSDKIKELKEIEKDLKSKIIYLENVEKIDEFNKIIVEEEREEDLLLLEEEFQTEDELEIKVRKIGEMNGFEYSLTLGNVGLLMNRKKQYDVYDGVYLKNSRKKTKKEYIKIYYKGTKDDSWKYYEKVEEYIRVNNIEVEDRYYEIALILNSNIEEGKYIRMIKIAKR